MAVRTEIEALSLQHPGCVPPILLARHGEKEPEYLPINFSLRLTAAGVADVESTAEEVAALGLIPSRVLCSPFLRCVETAAIYCRVFGIPQLCIEPALCEVLSPSLGAKGLVWPPAWTIGELAAAAQRHAPALLIDETYEPILKSSELELERSDAHRDALQARIEATANALCTRGILAPFSLLVSHGSPTRRLVDCLAPPPPDMPSAEEPPMGSILVVASGRVLRKILPGRRH